MIDQLAPDLRIFSSRTNAAITSPTPLMPNGPETFPEPAALFRTPGGWRRRSLQLRTRLGQHSSTGHLLKIRKSRITLFAKVGREPVARIHGPPAHNSRRASVATCIRVSTVRNSAKSPLCLPASCPPSFNVQWRTPDDRGQRISRMAPRSAQFIDLRSRDPATTIY